MLNFKNNVCFASDAGGASGGLDGVLNNNNGGSGAGQNPAWFSQLPKEVLENTESIDALKSFENIGALAQAYVKNSKDLASAVRFPGKDAKKEEVDAFFDKLGVPKSGDDYILENFDFKEEELAEAKKLFRETAHKSALTAGQAKSLWKNNIAMTKAVKALQAKQQEQLEANFKPSYDRLLSLDFPVKVEREKAINGEIGLVQSFLNETKLSDVLKASNFVYDAESMHKLAVFLKKYNPKFVNSSSGGEGEKDSSGKMGIYSEAFKEVAGL